MLQRLGIRGKLLSVVLVPVFVLLVAAAYITWISATSYRDASNAENMVDAVSRAYTATNALQIERDAGVNFVTAVQDSTNLLEGARAETDLRYQTLLDEAAKEGTPRAQEVVAAVNKALAWTAGAPLLGPERELAIKDGADGGWLVFPSNDDVFQMSVSYTEKSRQITELAETGMGGTDLQQEVAALGVQVATEGELANESFTVPVRFMETFQANENDVDEALVALESWLETIPSSEANDLPLQYFNAGLGIRDGIASIREDIATASAAEQTVKGYYSSTIRAFQSAAEAAVGTIPDPGTAAELQAFGAVDRLIEAILYESTTNEALIRRGVFISGEADFIKTIGVTTDIALADAKATVAQVPGLTPVPDFGASADGSIGDLWSFPQMRVAIQGGRNTVLVQSQNQNWRAQVDQEIAAFEPVRAEAFEDVHDATQAAERAAAIRVVVTGAIVLAAIVASVLVALLIARRIVNPLRRLTTTATAVRQELPRLVERVALPGQAVDVSEVQIPVESMDEVGRLAEAFNSVNAATLSIAAEQAALRGSISEMFINVARRDQVLLNRQLASIDEMERTQDDPDTLTKLFALDHLATRMRRNSESLLVLAGIDTGRRLRRPMPLSDVIRTASSEIELYERVQLELDEDPAMLGHSALTAAHLFAELLENATVFSDPGSPVIVRTMGIEGGCEVTITDSGIGMTPEELGEANARVASTAASEILGAQRLGLFVVGRIARRVGARVRLDSVEGEGTTATITMPASLFDMSADGGVGHLSSTARDDAVHAPAALVHRAEDFDAGVIPLPTPLGEPLATSGAASLVMDVPDEEMPSSVGVDKLVARDAEQAPVAVPVDLASLTAGTTGVGLPTRRRKEKGPEAPKDTSSIIGLPQRASDEQLSALTSAASSGFTPILAADEISPESAEQRARVFRGFRPIRGAEGEEPVVGPDSESLGHAVRRGALSPQDVLAAGVPSEAIPSLEPEPERTPLVAAHAEAILDAPAAPSPFAVQPADPRHDLEPVTTQDPRIAAGFDPTQTFGEGVPAVAGNPLAVPGLEDDEFVEDEPRVLTPWGRAARAAAQTAQSGQTQGVEALSTPMGRAPGAALPDADQPIAQQPIAQQPIAEQPFAQTPVVPPHAQVPVAPVQRSPLYPAVGATWQQAPQPDFAPDVVTSSPSLDQLILEGSRSSEPEKGGFFGKLFGKGKKEAPQGPSLNDLVPASTFPVDDPAGYAPVPPARGEFSMAAAPHEYAPGSGGFAVYDAPQAVGAPVSQGYQDAYAPGYGAEPSFDVAVLSGPIPAQAPAAAPSQWLATAPAGAPGMFAPGADQQAGAQPWTEFPTAPQSMGGHPAPLFDSSTGTFYSPDQLARPLGWETAGASALQAAAPEAEVAYAPVVEIASEPQYYADEEDVASAVFSELSSLAAERPKVHKTKAGLVKREPVEVQPQAVQEEPARPAPPRDPEAVRRKFSEFYSGTQRARSDVREYSESIQGSLTER